MFLGSKNVGSTWELFRIAGALSLLLTAHCFNLDTAGATISPTGNGSEFGDRVFQFGDDQNSWIGVMGKDQMGSAVLLRCPVGGGDCHPTNVTDSFNNPAALSMDASGPNLVVCDPNTVFGCMRNTWFPGKCIRFGKQLELEAPLDIGKIECIPEMLDVVFLFDGSNSLSKIDLEANKMFMLKMMEQSDADMQFAIVQYSAMVRTELSFATFQAQRENLGEIVNRIQLMESSTFTGTGIDYTISSVFTEEGGARKGAAKLLILITDGETTQGDLSLSQVIQKAKDKQITRYAIGVGQSFKEGSRGLNELKIIASSPAYLIKVKDYNELRSVFQDVKSKIYKIEGTQSSSESSFEMEMSQVGFSVLLNEDSVLLGAVGAYDWSGGLVEIRDKVRTFINVSKCHHDMKNAYLGYSVERAVYGNSTLYVVGAPRYQHKGKVVVFGQGGNETWEPKQHIKGEQIGSYFGAEIGVLDLDGDGGTDLLLIGAPLYYQPGYGGMVKVCSLTPEGTFVCNGSLQSERGDGLGRFGASIAVLRDLNGDGLSDVAVGAPLEDDRHGSIYIYQGVSGGLEENYSQRITGRQFSPSLMFFGQSVQGSMDMTGDNLTDVVVSAAGNVVLLRSRPVLGVDVEVFFQPRELGLQSYRCPWSDSKMRLVSNVSICFNLSVKGHAPPDALSVNLTYQLDLDRNRPSPRAQLETSEHRFTGSLNLSGDSTCVQHNIWLPACVEDSLTPLELNVSFSVTPYPRSEGVVEHLPPVLSHRCHTVFNHQLRMERNCGEDEIFTDYLILHAQYNGGTLVLGRDTILDLKLWLENRGKDSYNTSLRIWHPHGLQQHRIYSTNDSRVECSSSPDPARDHRGLLVCLISHPIFRQDQEMDLSLSFHIQGSPDWGEEATIEVEALSSNTDRITNETTRNITIPFQYAVEVVVTSLSTTRYIRFTGDDQGQKDVTHTYKVENLGPYPVPLILNFTYTPKIGNFVSWSARVDHKEDQKPKCSDPMESPKDAIQDLLKGKETSGIQVQTVVCNFHSNPNNKTEFQLKGFVQLQPSGDVYMTTLFSSALLSVNSSRHISQKGKLSLKAEGQTDVLVDPKSEKMLIAIGCACGLLLLIIVILILWKCGFFKRSFPESYDGGLQAAENQKMIGMDGKADASAMANDDEGPANGSSPSPNDKTTPPMITRL
ncbi:integrin alpha-M-like [Hypanus sabinus]|uniref:integrin alpha-M-like n=1 Tax=Hypanus sabinus TaxID=79690 RepID=UPI0028C45E64|nr:integrin alpha-M-like [Hypanus sabinus]XP_059809342.1 integrin alpha-M-like [Hypanus sabinus]XP_059809343.1 integrin alpha-M-like [Hypanus sabinus]XP_059809344.1 integrin alpha-M-like [Hypanus sabinus]